MQHTGVTHGQLFSQHVSHVERRHLQEASAEMYKFNNFMSAMFQCCRNIAMHNNCLVIPWSDDRLFIPTTKTKERYIAKATNSQYFTCSHLLKKSFLYLNLIDKIDPLVNGF